MSNEYNLLDVINLAIRQKLVDTRTACPAIVEKYDHNKQRLRVRLSINRGYQQYKFDDIILEDVPAVFSRHGNAGLSYPIKKGDQVLLLFNDRDLSQWKKSGSGFCPTSNELHPLSGAVAIAGLYPNDKPFKQKKEATELVGKQMFIGDVDAPLISLTTVPGTIPVDLVSILNYVVELIGTIGTSLGVTSITNDATNIKLALAQLKTPAPSPLEQSLPQE